MLTLEFVNEFVYEYFTNVTPSKNGNHFLARCVLCGDSKKSKIKRRFNLDYNDGNPIFHCFNCHRSGSFLQLYSILKGIDIEEAKESLYGYNPEYLIQRLSKRKEDKILKEIEAQNHNYVLENCVTEDKGVDSLLCTKWIDTLKKFREDRRIPESFKIAYAYEGDYKGRIILPIFDENDDIVYFQARRVPGTDIQPKYKNPTLKKGDAVLNKQYFDAEKNIIITEGLLDAITIGTQGTACLGSFISDDFIEKLIPLTTKNIIIAFDNDKSGLISLLTFMFGNKRKEPNKYAKKLHYFIMPIKYKASKDINKCVVDYSIEDVYNFILDNSYSYQKTYTLLYLNKLKDKLFGGK